MDPEKETELSPEPIEEIALIESASEELENLFNYISLMFDEFLIIEKQKQEQKEILMKEYNTFFDSLSNLINHIHYEIETLQNNVIKLEKELQRKHDVIQVLEERVNQEADKFQEKYDNERKLTEEYKEKYEEQKKELVDASEKIQQLENEISELQKKQEQSKEEHKLDRTYSAAMGSVMASLLWKTSKSQESIETYVLSGNMNSFLFLANNTILSFFETYGSNRIPSSESYELKYITSLFGVCINITAQKAGREFLLQRDVGEELIGNILTHLQGIPMPDGKILKRLALMFIYNLTFTKEGTILIQINEHTVDSITQCFDEHHTIEIKSIAVTLLNVLLNDPQKGFKKEVRRKISQKDENEFKKFLSEADSKTQSICTQFIMKLQADENDASGGSPDNGF